MSNVRSKKGRNWEGMTLDRVAASLKRRFVGTFHPRAIQWRAWQKNKSIDPIITRLGKDMRVRIYPQDVLGEEIYVEGKLEAETWGFIEKFLDRRQVFFDLGANLGAYTLLASSKVGSNGAVHSFEPSGRMFQELQFNVALNDFSDYCHLNKVAVSDIDGSAQLKVYQPGAEVFGTLGGHEWDGFEVKGEETVPTIRLDDYIKNARVERIDMIKMDIEGAELLALRGAKKILSDKDSPVIVFEINDHNTKGFGYKAMEIWEYLESFGYQMYKYQLYSGKIARYSKPADFALGQNLIAMKRIK